MVGTKLALIAGNGELPYLVASSAIESGREVLAVALSAEAERRLKVVSSPLISIHRYAPVEVYSILNLLQRNSARDLIFIGKVPKLEFFKSICRLDPKLLERVRALPDLHDDTLHYALLDFLETEHGLHVVEQTQYLRKYFPVAQVFTRRKPSDRELDEIRYGFKLAKSMAALDVGQTVAVQQKSIIAVEAIEGTNACIKRARKLLRWTPNKQVMICKVSKPNQDQRFDVPTIGIETIKQLGRGDILAIEAKETMFLNQVEAIKIADKRGICLLAI